MSNVYRGEWTEETLKALHSLRTKYNLSFPEISKRINKTADSCANKFKRVNWEIFFSKNKNDNENKSWTDETRAEIYFLRSKQKLTYSEIAKKTGRSLNSIQHIYKDTDWKIFFKNYSILFLNLFCLLNLKTKYTTIEKNLRNSSNICIIILEKIMKETSNG
jgi:hypothetical protein